MMEERITQLEKSLAFAQQAIDELMEVTSRQHKEVNALQEQLKRVEAKLDNDQPVSKPEDEPPPPHY